MAILRSVRANQNHYMVFVFGAGYLPLRRAPTLHWSHYARAQLDRKRHASSAAVLPDRSPDTVNIRPHTSVSHQQTGTFIQPPPTLANSFSEDIFLQTVLEVMAPGLLDYIKPDLLRFGERCVTDIFADHIELSCMPPTLQKYDVFGNHIDRVITSPAWTRMKKASAEEGLVAIAYERHKYEEYPRLYQMVKVLLFGASSGLYNCPLAMTDGAARVIEEMPGELETKSMSHAFNCLTSRDPEKFWTSGQWMTERAGGSDVRNATQTIAVQEGTDFYRLYGLKWFSSACDGEMALTLAKIDADSSPTMFYVEIRRPQPSEAQPSSSSSNNIHILQLKDKFGTRQLPTGELLLDGTVAECASERGKGISSISTMLNITRLHNAAAAVSTMRRVANIARDYSKRRTAFGRLLCEHPLHVHTLNELELQARVGTLVFLEAARLLSRQENSIYVNAVEALEWEYHELRILLPLLKLYTGKQAVAMCSEAMEALGGVGYLEGSQMPGYLRDAQVMPIWEGTTNVLALDVLRALNLHDEKAHSEAFDEFEHCISWKMHEAAKDEAFKHYCKSVSDAMQAIKRFVFSADDSVRRMLARELAFSMYKTYAAALLIEVNWERRRLKDEAGLRATLHKWCAKGLVDLRHDESVDSGDSQVCYDEELFRSSCGGDNEVNRYPV